MLIRPAPFPDEIDRGYLGRVIRFNGATNEKEIDTLMRAWAGVSDQTWREVSCLELLSKVAGMSVPEFSGQHTTLPFRRGITSYQPELRHGCDSNRAMLWTSGMRLARNGAYFCAECAHADQRFHGQSYWRRELQIPGLLWCPKHSTPLMYLDDPLAFLRSPADALGLCNNVPEGWAMEVMANKVIERYLGICFALLERSYPLDVKAVSTRLRIQASQRGFQTHGGPVKSPLLSDAVIEQCGRPWLATVMPALADKRQGTVSTKLDGVLYLKTSASSVISYALACAVLFDSADDAINALEQACKAPRSDGRQLNAVIDRDQLLSAYIQARGNYAETARQFRGPSQAIARQLRSLGMPNLFETANRSSLRAAVAFYIEERSLVESAALGEITLDVLGNMLRTSGCDFVRVLRDIHMPTGRGTGVRRPRQLTPAEASATDGAVVFKYSPHLRPAQRKSAQTELMDVQNVLQ